MDMKQVPWCLAASHCSNSGFPKSDQVLQHVITQAGTIPSYCTPAVQDGEVVIRPQMSLCATLDHRYVDGAQSGVLAKVVRDVLQNPWQLEGMDGPPARAEE